VVYKIITIWGTSKKYNKITHYVKKRSQNSYKQTNKKLF